MNLTNNFYQTAQLPNRTVWIDGREYLFFSGTSYLGLPQNSDFQQLIAEGLRQYGSVYGSSRNGNLQLEVYEQAEQMLATWAGAEAALTLSSGMLAGQAAVRQLWADGHTFFYSPDAHPAVWHTPTVNIPKISFDEWAAEIITSLPKDVPVALVTNAADALRGKLYNFDWVAQLPQNQPITLLIDDSHGLGVRSEGVFAQIPKNANLKIVVTASLAKAMGLAGGVILADTVFLQKLRTSAYFGGCSPMAPHQLWAYLHAQSLYEDTQQKLHQNTTLFTTLTQDLGLFSNQDHYPVFHTHRDDLYPFLLQNQVFIYSFSYPKPTDKANTRIVLSAWHTPADLHKLAHLCQRFVGLS
jgi:8-amino-7-oxononanoate synthase